MLREKNYLEMIIDGVKRTHPVTVLEVLHEIRLRLLGQSDSTFEEKDVDGQGTVSALIVKGVNASLRENETLKVGIRLGRWPAHIFVTFQLRQEGTRGIRVSLGIVDDTPNSRFMRMWELIQEPVTLSPSKKEIVGTVIEIMVQNLNDEGITIEDRLEGGKWKFYEFMECLVRAVFQDVSNSVRGYPLPTQVIFSFVNDVDEDGECELWLFFTTHDAPHSRDAIAKGGRVNGSLMRVMHFPWVSRQKFVDPETRDEACFRVIEAVGQIEEAVGQIESEEIVGKNGNAPV
jgi:hypothetical protein